MLAEMLTHTQVFRINTLCSPEQLHIASCWDSLSQAPVSPS